jgi:hypothetical protein
MHAHDGFATGSQGEASGMIEAMTRDVQVTVVAVRFQSLEAKQTVIRTGNQLGDLGGSHLDHTAVGRDDDDPRIGPVDLPDAKVPAKHLVLRKFGE